MALAALALYATFRMEHVGGADSYGYYSLSLLFEQGRMSLPVGLDPERFPAVAPLGYVADGAEVLPTYSPGFPFLMYLLRPLGLEFFVTPLLGAASVLIVYALCLQLVGWAIALFYAALWAASPIVVWGGTEVMSDGVAAFFACLALLLCSRQLFGWSGLVIGLALAVRPANVVMFGVVAGALALRGRPLLGSRDLMRFLALFAIGVTPIAIYDWLQYGSPLKTGYGDVTDELRAGVFWHHLTFYLGRTAVVLSPLVLLALVPLVTAFRRHAFWLAWFLAFLVFYSFWWPGADTWWYTRFLLPGYPALVVLAAVGTEQTLSALRQRAVRTGYLVAPGCAVVGLATLAGLLHFADGRHLFQRGRNSDQATDSRAIRAAVEPDALVGCIDFSGSLRLYGGIETFRWDHESAVATIEHGLTEGRPVYLVVEPWNWEHRRLGEIQQRFTLERALTLSTWHDTHLWRVAPVGGERPRG